MTGLPVFRNALGRVGNQSVQELAAARPGALLQSGPALMHQIASPTEVMTEGKQMLPQAAKKYLNQVVSNLKGKILLPRTDARWRPWCVGWTS